MYSRGYPPQSPRFSPNRRGSGGNHHYNPYNNNGTSNLTNCGFQQRQHYRTPSPRGSQQYTSPSPQFQIPRSPMEAMFLGPAVPSPYGGGGHVPRGGYSQGAPGISPYSAQRSPRHFSPRQNTFPYCSSPRGRGNFSQGKTSTPKFRGGRPGRGKNKNIDCNPGGSSDIRMYYNNSMMEDPWKRLSPKPFINAPPSTT